MKKVIVVLCLIVMLIGCKAKEKITKWERVFGSETEVIDIKFLVTGNSLYRIWELKNGMRITMSKWEVDEEIAIGDAIVRYKVVGRKRTEWRKDHILWGNDDKIVNHEPDSVMRKNE